MNVRGRIGQAYDIVFRELPHRDKTGLMKVGNPKRDSPVIVTGNYTETVRRVRAALKGEDVWLLVTNSKGINVWCAAGGGHLTHHDVISALVTSSADAEVDSRTLVLPQLGATGIERQKIADATGWTAVWGPARAEDLPSFLRQGHRATPKQRFMRFPLWERMEMAFMWWLPLTVVGVPLFGWLGGWPVGVATGVDSSLIAFGLFAALPWLKVEGRIRWAIFGLFALMGSALGLVILALDGVASPYELGLVTLASVVSAGVLSVDLAGTTPWYGSYINTFHNRAHIDLVVDRCTGTSECVQVCPRSVLEMTPYKRSVHLAHPGDCIQCGACVVQCPRDALRFRWDDGRIAEATTIRKTRMNMLGRRTVRVEEGGQ